MPPGRYPLVLVPAPAWLPCRPRAAGCRPNHRETALVSRARRSHRLILAQNFLDLPGQPPTPQHHHHAQLRQHAALAPVALPPPLSPGLPGQLSLEGDLAQKVREHPARVRPARGPTPKQRLGCGAVARKHHLRTGPAPIAIAQPPLCTRPPLLRLRHRRRRRRRRRRRQGRAVIAAADAAPVTARWRAMPRGWLQLEQPARTTAGRSRASVVS
jgi:hypothetical protein